MDYIDRGYITTEDLATAWGMSPREVDEICSEYDVNQDQYIDRMEFRRMMCPAEYRLPECAGGMRDLFGKMLEDQLRRGKRKLHLLEEGVESTGLGLCSGATPKAILPVAPPFLLNDWIDRFNDLDLNKDGRVELRELKQVGFLSPEVSTHLVEVLEPGEQERFTQKAFLTAVAQMEGYRLPKEYDFRSPR